MELSTIKININPSLLKLYIKVVNMRRNSDIQVIYVYDYHK